jgi:hypothetical protein
MEKAKSYEDCGLHYHGITVYHSLSYTYISLL